MNENRHELSVLKPGQPARIQPIDRSTIWKEGIVIKALTNGTYEVESKGKTYPRNRGFIRPVKKAAHDLPQEPQKQRIIVPVSAPRGHGAEAVVKEAENQSSKLIRTPLTIVHNLMVLPDQSHRCHRVMWWCTTYSM